LAGSAAAQEQVDDLLEAEGDDQADADGDEVEEHIVGTEHEICGHGIADRVRGVEGLGRGGVQCVEASVDAVVGALVGGGHALWIEVERCGAEAVDVGPGDGMGEVGVVVGEAAEGVAVFDVFREGGFGELDDLIEALGAEVGGVGIEDIEAAGVVDGVPVIEILLVEAGERCVELLIGVGLGEGHLVSDAAFLGCVPNRVIVEEGRLVPDEVAGEGGFGRAGMLANVLEDEEVVLEASGGAKPVVLVCDEVVAIGFELAGEGFAGFAELVALVDVFDELLEADGDDEANDDGGDMDEEVFPGVGGVSGRVDVEHGVAPELREVCRIGVRRVESSGDRDRHAVVRGPRRAPGGFDSGRRTR
jgi:hypothetical protein